MNLRYDVVALGDVNLDYVVQSNLPFGFSSLVENGRIWWEDIKEVPGGSGLNFSVFAKQEGYQSLLLARVGDDLAGGFISDWLNEKEVSFLKDWKSNYPTGKAIIMRDKADIRLLVNNKQNANQLLSTADIDSHKEWIASCQVLYISGYCISEADTPRFSATLRAMEYARTAPAPRPTVVFDVVPHQIYTKYQFHTFLQYTSNVDILISEVATMRRFLGLGSREEKVDLTLANETAQIASQYYDRLILRYGFSGCDEQILVDNKTNTLEHNQTNHKLAKDKRGFGDRLTLRSLRDFFHVFP